MSDTQNSPDTPEPSPVGGHDGSMERVEIGRVEIGPEGEILETDVTSDTVTMRRSPRYGRFIVLGAALGVLVALILTYSFSGQPADDQLGLGFDKGQVFGFLLLVCGTIGAALGAVVALIFDRVFARRTRSMTAEHESTHRVDD